MLNGISKHKDKNEGVAPLRELLYTKPPDFPFSFKNIKKCNFNEFIQGQVNFTTLFV